MVDTDDPAEAQPAGSFGYATIAVALLGLFVSSSGVLLASASLLDGAWLVAIGFSVALAGVVDTPWAGRHLGLSAADRRTLSFSLSGLAAVLLAAFLLHNGFGGVDSGGLTD